MLVSSCQWRIFAPHHCFKVYSGVRNAKMTFGRKVPLTPLLEKKTAFKGLTLESADLYGSRKKVWISAHDLHTVLNFNADDLDKSVRK
jgi:hypothetical protein